MKNTARTTSPELHLYFVFVVGMVVDADIIHRLVGPLAFMSLAFFQNVLSAMTTPLPLSTITVKSANDRLRNLISPLLPPYIFKQQHFSTILAILRPSPLFYGLWFSKLQLSREKLKTPDGGTIVLDWFEPDHSEFSLPTRILAAGWRTAKAILLKSPSPDHLPLPPSSTDPLILVIHGLMGHSEETYVRQTCAQLCICGTNRPRVVAMNYRGAMMHEMGDSGAGVGGYSLYDTLDLASLISHLRESHDGPLYCVGFSMGAAKLANYVGRTGVDCQVDAIACVSCPWDFTERNRAVHRPSLVERIYHFILTNGCKAWVAIHHEELRAGNKALEKSPAFRRTRSGLLWWLTTHNMRTFDSTFTVHNIGYESVEKYYECASPINNLDGVAVPMLIINSQNDPLIPACVNPSVEAVEKNENVIAVESVAGGHIGFFVPSRGCYATSLVSRFFQGVEVAEEDIAIRSSPVMRRRKSSSAAEMLKCSSRTGLNNYEKAIMEGMRKEA